MNLVLITVLGTLIDKDKQLKALIEIKKTLKSGKIILVENNLNSEFEAIRGRDKDSRTQDYNNFLLNNGFHIVEKIDTYFKFKNKEIANDCFYSIWGKNLKFKLNKNTVEHKVIIFSN